MNPQEQEITKDTFLRALRGDGGFDHSNAERCFELAKKYYAQELNKAMKEVELGQRIALNTIDTLEKTIAEKDMEIKNLEQTIKNERLAKSIERQFKEILEDHIKEKDGQIKELMEDVIGFSNWKVRNEFEAQYDSEPMWINRNDENHKRFTTEELYSKYSTGK